jgi:virulence-associated protein VagC
MDAKIVEDGLLIPRRLLNKLGTDNFEVLTRDHEIVIRPRTKTRQYYGFVGVTKVDEDFLEQLEHDWEESGEI